MNISSIEKEIRALPPEAQKQVIDFITFLQERYPAQNTVRVRRIKIKKEPFIGMWKGRVDMRNSVEWVRQTRKTQWRIKP